MRLTKWKLVPVNEKRVKKFAFLPTKIYEGWFRTRYDFSPRTFCWIWLESYSAHYWRADGKGSWVHEVNTSIEF